MKKFNFDYRKSLEDLENEKWEKPDFDSSLVRKVLTIRQKPIKDLTIEELRIMIGQNFSLDYIIPLALKVIKVDPFAEGDFYPGDLLVHVLSVNKDFWEKNSNLYQEVKQIINKAQSDLAKLHDGETEKKINNAIQGFKSRNNF